MKARASLRSTGQDGPPSEEVLLGRLAPRVREWVARCIGPTADLDDIAQEALIQVAGALHRYEGHASIETYCRRIVMRTAIRERKRRGHARTAPLTEVRDEGHGPDGILAKRQRIEALYRAMAALSDPIRMAVTLCDIEGQRHEEAAEVLDVSVVALRARLKRGRKQLRELLSHAEDGGER